MPNYNRVILAGHLTRDVELRSTQGGTQIARFGIAVNRKFTANGEQKESTCFVDCVAWGKTGEIIAQYAAKGSALLVDGRLEYSTWEAQDGGKRSKLEVVVENFQFLSSDRPATAKKAQPAQRTIPAPSPPPPAEYDDIPF